MAESQQWLPMVNMFGLLGCGIPITLKAHILQALAHLAKSPEVAAVMWQTLEMSQVDHKELTVCVMFLIFQSDLLLLIAVMQLLTTTLREGSKQSGGLVTELEEVETRAETYPMLRSFLDLISNLCLATGQPPEGLGAGIRPPGFHPYLNFIINNVLLKFNLRRYRKPEEKVRYSQRITVEPDLIETKMLAIESSVSQAVGRSSCRSV